MSTVIEFKNIDATIKEKIEVYGTSDEPWFRGGRIAKILGYKDTKDAVQRHVNAEDKIMASKLIEKISLPKKLDPKTILINKRGLDSLVCRSRLPNSIEIAKKLGINLLQKVTIKECDIMEKLFKIFDRSSIKYLTQYSVKENESLFNIDCYLPDFKIAIEIDEYGHKDRNPQYEKNREEIIKKQLGCTFIRENPDSDNFCIFLFIGKIFNGIMNKSSEKYKFDKQMELDKLKLEKESEFKILLNQSKSKSKIQNISKINTV